MVTIAKVLVDLRVRRGGSEYVRLPAALTDDWL